MDVVSNQVFEMAYAKTENRKVMNEVVSGFRKTISREALVRCGMIGLWKALKKHRDEKGNKFTTSLWMYVQWECLHELRDQRKQWDWKRIEDVEEPALPPNRMEGYQLVEEKLASLNDDSRNIIQQHYLEGMSLRDIGVRNGYSHEWARKKLAAAMADLKERCIG